MALDAFRMGGQRLAEGRAVGIAAEAGEGFELARRLGQGLGLLVVAHLQAMLDGAQPAVGFGELVARLRCDPAFVGQLLQHVERARAAQSRAPAAEDELLGLDEELDLADAAAAELHVVSGHRDGLVALHRLDLALHRVNVGYGGEIEIFPPDEGREVAQEAPAQLGIAGDGARLDHGGAFPVLPDRLVIGIGTGQCDRDMGRGRVGPQAQVDAEDVAVRRALLDDAGDLLRQPDEEARRLPDAGRLRRLGIEEDHDVDIGGVVQLAGAVLA